VVKHDFDVIVDNTDDVEFQIRTFDYEVGDLPTGPYQRYENRTPPHDMWATRAAFWSKVIYPPVGWDGNPEYTYPRDPTDNHNISYLMNDGEEPNLSASNLKRLRVYALPGHGNPVIVPKDRFGVGVSSITIVADQEYDALLAGLRNGGNRYDELKLLVELQGPTVAAWNIRAQAPHQFNTYYPVDKMGEEVITLLISLDDPADYASVPEGEYTLKLTAESKMSGYMDEKWVTITLKQRWRPEINLDSEDTSEKIAITDGNATSFKFKLKNNGTLTDNISLSAEVSDMAGRAGATNDDWTRTFYPASQITVEPGETVEVLVNLTPELDNEKIPPGKYPIYVNVTSINNLARTDRLLVYVRMPNLYNLDYCDFQPPAGDAIQIGTEGVFTFTVKNAGKVDDTFTFGFTIRDGDGTLIASDDVPGDWVYIFEDADTGSEFTDNQLALTADEPKNVRFKLTPPVGLSAGDYDIDITIISAGPTKVKETIPTATFAATRPDLSIDSIEIIPGDVKEGDEVKIRATVRLTGAIDKAVKVQFHYHTAAAGFTFIDEVDLDFRGKANTAETVEITWKAKVSYSKDQNIKVLVDTGNNVTEEKEDNNEVTVTLTVREPPDEGEDDYSPVLRFLLMIIALLLVLLVVVVCLPAAHFQKKPREEPGQ